MAKTTPLQPQDFELETNTVWAFPNRGKWATHNAKFRGNFSPYIPRNVILRYSQEGDTVLDMFVGGGTTMVEAKLTNRNAIGIDINPNAVEITKNKLNFECEYSPTISVYEGDARNLSIDDNSIDLICTHPPYSDIIKYSDDIDGDLSHYKIKDFLFEMEKVAKECYRVLKKDKYCALLMGDTRKKGMVQPLAFDTMQIFNKCGFKTKEIIIKEQHNCKETHFWRAQSIKFNFLLLAHEYLFIFKK